MHHDINKNTKPIQFTDFKRGSVWLCGAGPGDPGLITCLCKHALENADYIIYDALVNNDIFSFAHSGVFLEYAGKRGGKPSPKQKDITLRLIELAKQGKRVLRLKGGDPFIFGRGAEEAVALRKAGIPFRIVPGVSAGIGGLAYAGIPLTYRETNQAVTLITGHDATGEMPHAHNWAVLAQTKIPLVFYMAIKHIDNICTTLLENGRSEQETCAVVTNASLPNQAVNITILKNLSQMVKQQNIQPPAIIVMGDNVDMHKILDWFIYS